jgi:demethylmenaquinone methyltransferase/2-methoxy-6-polyprenyl-1,4-benzoquinol methylase
MIPPGCQPGTRDGRLAVEEPDAWRYTRRVTDGVRPLEGMFAGIHRRYDLLNRVLTVGLDRRWREAAARLLLEGSPRTILDLCTGTGDLASLLARRVPPGVLTTGADFSRDMLGQARLKVHGLGVALVRADAADLPFADHGIDRVGIAFGLRNLTHRNPGCERHLAEIRRILSPRGRLVVVETSQPRGPVLRAGFHAYLLALAGPLGGALSGEARAYRYLARSARGFAGPEAVRRLLLGAGFRDVRYLPLLGGAACIHSAGG